MTESSREHRDSLGHIPCDIETFYITQSESVMFRMINSTYANVSLCL